MTRRRKIIAAALAAGIALPVGAYAQGGFDGGDWNGPRKERVEGRDWRGGPGGWRHHGPRRGGPGMLWNVAEKLSAAETALAITPEQQPAWRAFTGAVVAFVQSGRGGMMAQPMDDGNEGPDAAAPDAGPADEAGAQPSEAADEADDQADDGATDQAAGSAMLEDSRGVRRMERFLDRSIARGQAAQRVKSALDGLSAVLTPEQARTADRLLAELGPRGGPRHGFGPGRDGPMGRHGPEGRGPGMGEDRDAKTPPPPPPAPAPAGEAPAPAPAQ